MGANEEMISDISSQDAGMTGEAGGWLSTQTLAGMAADPAMQNMIATLQEDACTTFSAIVDKTAAMLMQDVESSPATRESGPLTTQQAARLAMDSKRRGQAWQKARELAEMLVIGALINKDNPNWDPADPSTCMKMGQDGALLSLIRFDQDGQNDQDGVAAQESLNG